MNFADNLVATYEGRIMKEGDLVILYEGHDALDYLTLSNGTILNNKFGAFYHREFIGKPYGSKIIANNGKSFLYALQCTPELWSVALKTRTQIVDSIDGSVVAMALDLYPGCVVAESGTGSGCMTLAMARCVAPTGHIHTYEYNPNRAEAAKQEFKKLNVDSLITVNHHDVCEPLEGETNADSGYAAGGFLGIHEKESVDAIFLDLPEPWRALDYVKDVLKPGRNICCYSPCIEQVIKTCAKLRELGFYSIKMIEARQRPYEGKQIELEVVDMGQPIPGIPDSVLVDVDTLSNASDTPIIATSDHNGTKVNSEKADDAEDSHITKRMKIEASTESNDAPINIHHPRYDAATGTFRPRMVHYKPRKNIPAIDTGLAKSDVTMKGHTAFLTFATCPASEKKA